MAGMNVDWPQPYEGIHGTDRDDWLLSLDERAIPHRDALLAMAGHLRSATLVGHPAPLVEDMGRRIEHPQPGDLVAEATSAMYKRRRGPEGLDDRIKGLGILLARRHEWSVTDQEWERFCDEERAVSTDPGVLELITSLDNRTHEDVIYIQYGPAAVDIARWANAEVICLPVQVASFSAVSVPR